MFVSYLKQIGGLMTATIRGNRIRQRRQALGWSLRRLAKEVGTAPTTLWRIEQGLRIPKVDLFYRIAKALGLKPQELLR